MTYGDFLRDALSEGDDKSEQELEALYEKRFGIKPRKYFRRSQAPVPDPGEEEFLVGEFVAWRGDY